MNLELQNLLALAEEMVLLALARHQMQGTPYACMLDVSFSSDRSYIAHEPWMCHLQLLLKVS